MKRLAHSWTVPLLLTIIAAGLRFFELGTPNFKMYDEFFYARDACTYVVEGQFFCGDVEESWAHPPVAKWLIAVGIWAFAPTAIGARVAAAVIGVLSVLVLYFLAQRVTGSVWAAAGAALLLAIDPLHLVNSRAAVLDTFAGFFVLVALLAYVNDRRIVERGSSVAEGDDSLPFFKRDMDLSRFRSRWLLVCGLASGLAIGSKWTVAPVLPGLIAVVLWDARNRAASQALDRPFFTALRTQAVRIVLCLIVVPLSAYSFSFVGRIDGSFTAVPWERGAWARELIDRQVDMAGYHLVLREEFSEDEIFFQSSPAWSWPLLKRGFPYSFMIRDGRYYEVLATGNPFVWWAGLIAIAALVGYHLRSRSEEVALKVVLVGFAGTYLYWLVAGIGATQVYLNYFVPAVPFLCLAVAWAWTKLYRSWVGRSLVALHAAAAVGMFVFLLPVLLFRPLSPEQWERRMLFSQCRPHEVGKKIVVAGFKFEADDLGVSFVRSFEKGEKPPADSMVPMLAEADGWCWR